MTTTQERAGQHIDERCFICNKPLKDGKPDCSHPKVSNEGALLLMQIEECDHFCCGMTANECKATKLSAELLRQRLEEAKWQQMNRLTQEQGWAHIADLERQLRESEGK